MMNQAATDYTRIERAIRYLDEHAEDQPGLADVADVVGLSSARTQRLFRRWAGVSPKRFLEFLTVEHAKVLLDGSASVLDASFAVGLSGPGRLHDHFVTLEAISPGEYKLRGRDVDISFGVHESPFGSVFLASTNRGLLKMVFLNDRSADDEIQALRLEWPEASVSRNQVSTVRIARRIFDPEDDGEQILIRVRGTNFQLGVWKALLEIPHGGLATYSSIAQAIGRPQALRAVGNAVASNPVAYLIPCHRVIRQSGALGNYRWGSERKRAMIAWEAARAS